MLELYSTNNIKTSRVRITKETKAAQQWSSRNQIWNVNRVLESYPAIGILPAAVGVPLLLKRFVVRKKIEFDAMFLCKSCSAKIDRKDRSFALTGVG